MRQSGYIRSPADVAQLVEPFTRNEGVPGSSPGVGSMRLRFSRGREAQTPGSRRVRITHRCLSADLHEHLPAADVDLGAIDHPVLRRARELAPSFPAGLARIQGIDDARVFRFAQGRARVATWLDEPTGTLWVCGVDEGDDAAADGFAELHARGELLPGDDDVRREQVEAAARLVVAIREGVPRWLDEARVRPNHDVLRALPGGPALRVLFRPGDVEEYWVAMPVLGTPRGLSPRLRAVVVARVQQHLGGVECEQRSGWPTGELTHHEVASFGVR